MKPNYVAIAVLSIGALVIPATPPQAGGQMRHESRGGSPRRLQIGSPAVGRQLFAKKGCVLCHSIRGEGGNVGPDLAKASHTHNIYSMAAIMWNHSPHMREVMEQRGVKRPQFKGDEMAHLMAYLHSLEVVGDPKLGKALFTEKGCVKCHAIQGEGGKIGPDLGRSMHPHPPLELSGVMWNHSPTMTAMMTALGMERAVFDGNEMADLLSYLDLEQHGMPAGGAAHPH